MWADGCDSEACTVRNGSVCDFLLFSSGSAHMQFTNMVPVLMSDTQGCHSGERSAKILLVLARTSAFRTAQVMKSNPSAHTHHAQQRHRRLIHHYVDCDA